MVTIDAILAFVLLTFLEIIPMASLYVIILASTPFIAAGILVLNRMGRKIRATMQAGDIQQEKASITPFVLVTQLVILPNSPVYEFIQRSRNIQLSLNFGMSCIFTIAACAYCFSLAIRCLRESSRRCYLRFSASLVLLVVIVLFEYGIVRTFFHLI